MRIAVFGVGAIGGYFGGRLAEAGNEVVFIARGKILRALREHGLQVESIDGDFTIKPVEATDQPAEVGDVDVVLLGVKAWQVPEVAESLLPMISSETCVLPLQNGVEAPKQLASVLGEKHVLGGLCKIISYGVGPGRIRHAGAEPYVALGELDNKGSKRVAELLSVLSAAGVTAEVPENIQVAMWQKFLFICSVSGVGAVTRAAIGVMRELPETRSMVEQCMHEIVQVAQAHKIALPADSIEKAMAFVDSLPPAGTASMQRDIMEGRPSELESQNGAVVRLGKKIGVATPVNSFIYRSLLPMEMQARGQ